MTAQETKVQSRGRMPEGTEQVNGRIRLTPFTHSLVHSFLHSFIDPVNVY